MKKIGLCLLPILAMTLLLAGNAFAVDDVGGDNSYYFVTYYSNANTTGAPDGVLRIINDGSGSGATGVVSDDYRDLYASIYVFDDSQEMQECCSCEISADGLLSESVNKQLTANELTGRAETSRGVIKVVSSLVGNPTNNAPFPGLRGWMTHTQATASPSTKPFFVSEAPLADSNLSAAEIVALQESCSFAITLGSGYGVCSCTPEDQDF